MRGKEMRAAPVSPKGEAIILAVRFERERDSRSLFSMLSNTPWIRPQRGGGRKTKQPRNKSRRRPPPPWFLAMGTREQENVRALVSNAQIEYLEDGTIQRQLATIYKLTPQQIDEAIDFFQPWLKLGNAAGGGSRSFSIGTRTDVSSLPSIHTSKIVPNIAPLQRVRSPKALAVNPAPYPYDQNPKPPLDYPKPGPAPAPPEAKVDNPAPGPSPPSPAADNKPKLNAPSPNAGPTSPAQQRRGGPYESNQMYESNARSSRKGSRL